jgi:hypothetical protein
MFKKFLLVLVAVFSLFAFTACGKRTYKADGVYTAFSASVNKGAPQVTAVTVTIKDDKIDSFYIDCLQSTAVKTDDVVTGFNFNEKTKKELGYGYRMHGKRELSEEKYKEYLEENDLLEWFEQAELLEAYFKANGTTLETDKDGKIQNVTNVTIADSDYSKLAAEAVANAKAGKVQNWTAYVSGTQVNLVWAEGTVNEKGELTSLTLDTLQGRFADGAVTWNEKAKQELGYLYGMHNKGDKENDYTAQDLKTTAGLDAYKAYLNKTGKKEWFEQANLLSDYVLKNGLTNVKVATGGKLENAPEGIATITVTVSHYVDVMKALLADLK